MRRLRRSIPARMNCRLQIANCGVKGAEPTRTFPSPSTNSDTGITRHGLPESSIDRAPFLDTSNSLFLSLSLSLCPSTVQNRNFKDRWSRIPTSILEFINWNHRLDTHREKKCEKCFRIVFSKVVSKKKRRRSEERGTARGRIDDRIWNGGHFPAVIREPR